jgi:hypothetical protein
MVHETAQLLRIHDQPAMMECGANLPIAVELELLADRFMVTRITASSVWRDGAS